MLDHGCRRSLPCHNTSGLADIEGSIHLACHNLNGSADITAGIHVRHNANRACAWKTRRSLDRSLREPHRERNGNISRSTSCAASYIPYATRKCTADTRSMAYAARMYALPIISIAYDTISVYVAFNIEAANLHVQLRITTTRPRYILYTYAKSSRPLHSNMFMHIAFSTITRLLRKSQDNTICIKKTSS